MPVLLSAKDALTLAMEAAGASTYAMAAAVGETRPELYRRRMRLGLPMRDPRSGSPPTAWPPDRVAELKRLRGEGLSYAAIGRRMGVTKAQAIGAARRAGWAKTPARLARKLTPYRREVLHLYRMKGYPADECWSAAVAAPAREPEGARRDDPGPLRESPSPSVRLVCHACGGGFERQAAWVARNAAAGDRHFCSRACMARGQRIEPDAAFIAANSAPIPYCGCWIWSGAPMQTTGYGRFGKQAKLAHRASYEAFKGEIPPGIAVRHTCHVRLCVNPDHLMLATPAAPEREAA